MTDPSPAVAALSNTLTVTLASDRELVMTRAFAASRPRMWEMFTRAEHLANWWGPRGFSLDPNHLDFRVGGTWHYAMVSDFMDPAWGKMVYQEIVAPERFVAIDCFSDESGAIIPPSSTITFEFEERDGGTLLKSRALYATPEDLQAVIEMGMVEGMGSSLDRLEDVLAGRAGGTNSTSLVMTNDTEIMLARTFSAPADLLFKALTQPEHVRKWGAPFDMVFTECEIDLRVGGSWRYVQRDPKSGEEYPFSGEFREIVPGERIVRTERFELISGAESLVTITLEARGEQATRLVSRSVYASREDRDGHIAAGMEAGVRDVYDRLEALLATL